MIIDENWHKVMKETKGTWREHPVFKEMDGAVEIINWMREKYPKIAKKVMKK